MQPPATALPASTSTDAVADEKYALLLVTHDPIVAPRAPRELNLTEGTVRSHRWGSA